MIVGEIPLELNISDSSVFKFSVKCSSSNRIVVVTPPYKKPTKAEMYRILLAERYLKNIDSEFIITDLLIVRGEIYDRHILFNHRNDLIENYKPLNLYDFNNERYLVFAREKPYDTRHTGLDLFCGVQQKH